MLIGLNDIVITDANREAYEMIIHATDKHDSPLRYIVVGPRGAGKSSIALARAKEPDLLSRKKVVAAHAGEILAMLTLSQEISGSYLDMVGEAHVLLLDDLEEFFNPAKEDFGPLACKYLLDARNKAHLDTIVISNVALDTLDLDQLGGVLDGYDVMEVGGLDEAGELEFLRRREAHYTMGMDNPPRLSDEVCAFLLQNTEASYQDLDEAVKKLVHSSDFEPGTVIGLATAKKVLAS